MSPYAYWYNSLCKLIRHNEATGKVIFQCYSGGFLYETTEHIWSLIHFKELHHD